MLLLISGNILLELLTTKPEISENWSMIKKIIQTLGNITPKLATKIFHLATNSYPLDKKLLLEIKEVIIKNNLTDLSQISKNALVLFKALEGFNDTTTSSLPCTQTVIRLPLITNKNSGEICQSENIRNSKKRFTTNQNQKTAINNGDNSNRVQIRREYNKATGQITTSCGSSSTRSTSSTDSDDRYLSSSIDRVSNERPNSALSAYSNAQESVSFTNNQYIPPHVFPENR